jgi:heme-degrading monooxygenase HmoA
MTFIKWIRCSVADADRDRFSAAQRGWSGMAASPGLIAQVGGWDEATGEACILSCWTSRASYEAFMTSRHDEIAAQSGQRATYQAIHVTTGHSVVAIRGQAGPFAEAVCQGIFLRVADCWVRPGRQEHFTAAQRDIWLPGMATADGMLGGLFSQLDADRFLVTTWWRSAEAHQDYAATRVAGLRRRAAAEDDLAALRGYLLTLQPDWHVAGYSRL